MRTNTNTIKRKTSLLKRYDPESMDFLKWLNHFEFIVDFLYINKYEKVNFLLRKLNLKALSDITQKVAPHNPYSLPYEELIFYLQELYGLFQGEWAANYRFILRHQFYGESIQNYLIALSRIARNMSNFLRFNESLILQFIKGLKNENTRKVLLGANDLTIENAVAIAVQLEYDPV